jgi:hypothetical protein
MILGAGAALPLLNAPNPSAGTSGILHFRKHVWALIMAAVARDESPD